MLQTLRESPVPHLHCETTAAATASPSHLVPAGLEHYHGPPPCHALVCQQAMQPQQSASLTASPRGPSPTPQLQPQALHGCVPAVPSNSPMCCGPYGLAVVPPGAMEETLAAYCHHQPIPAHVQMLPPRGLPGGAEAQMLALPRLISSLSETGLDAKRMLRCCNLDCGWSNVQALHSQPHVGNEGWVNANTTTTTTTVATRDMGTMTSRLELRDVGVQAEQALETPPPHMFPEVCLADDGANGAAAGAAARAPPTGKKNRASLKSPIKEVKWDAEGMTWEVYGASVDPEELGTAIQKHLELQIKETVSRAAKLTRQNTNASQGAASSESARGRKRKGLMESLRGSLRGPGCCTHATTAVE